MQTIQIAKEFSPVPAGRFLKDGPFSGERFREEILRPRLSRGGEVTIDLNGGEGYGSSFLEEAFGGLVRKGYFNKADLKARLRLVADDPTYIEEIWSYIDEALVESAH